MNRKSLLFTVTILALLFAACTVQPYNPTTLISHTHADSLMVDLVTYLGKRPRTVMQADRHNPIHRDHFAELAQKFEFVYYHPNQAENKYYYYIIRPARNHSGNVNRAVGGWFSLNDSNKISYFTEVFNTHIQPIEQLKEEGLLLFEEMIKSQTIELTHSRKDLIEWPNDRTFYNDSINDWVYRN